MSVAQLDRVAVFGTAHLGSSPSGHTILLINCAGSGNRNRVSSLARKCSTTKPYPQYSKYYTFNNQKANQWANLPHKDTSLWVF